MPGRGQQFGYCWSPVDPGHVDCAAGGGWWRGRDRLMSEQFRKGSVLSLEGQVMILRERWVSGRGFLLPDRAFCSLNWEMLGSLDAEFEAW